VDDLLDAAERAWRGATGAVDEPYEPSVGRAASLLANVPAAIALDRAYVAGLRGEVDRAITLGRQALAELGEDEWMLDSMARWQLAAVTWLDGRLAAAERTLSASIARWRAAGEPTLAVRGCALLGQVQRAQGRLGVALGTYRRALDIAAAPGRPPLPVAGIAFVGMAEVAYQRGELDSAWRHATEAIPLCRQLAYTQPLAAGLTTLAWIRQSHGDVAGALEAIDEAALVAPGQEMVSLVNPVPTQRVRLLLAQGAVAEAARWTEQHGLGADDEVSYPREPDHLVLIRVLLASDRPTQARGLLERLHTLAVRQQRTGSLVEIQALRALALAAGGDETGAIAALTEALTLARPEGYVRVFADEGAPMGALLGRLIAAQRTGQGAARTVPLGYLGRVVRAFQQATAGAGSRAGAGAAIVPGLVEPLSDRGLEVLRLLAAGKPNQRIAEELVVALNTVKKHVAHIFDKLGATTAPRRPPGPASSACCADPGAPETVRGHRSSTTSPSWEVAPRVRDHAERASGNVGVALMAAFICSVESQRQTSGWAARTAAISLARRAISSWRSAGSTCSGASC
jgi:LuxR family transcriptional regulator, maltose regulon positive regulatory protein